MFFKLKLKQIHNMKLKSYLFLAGISLTTFSFAQEYTLQTTQEVYQELQNPTLLSTGFQWDDDIYGIELPFSFSIGGISLDSIFVFEGAISSENFAMGIDDGVLSTNPLATVVAVGSDLVDRGYHDAAAASLSPISYEFLTENGNQILAVEFKNAGFLDEEVTGTSVDYVNLQIRLIEDNTIEIHYGESNISFPEEYFDNELGNIVAVMPNYQITDTAIVLNEDIYILEGLPAAPTIDIMSDATDLMNGIQGLNAYPDNGTKYTFSMSNVGQQELDHSGITIVNPVYNTLEFSTDVNIESVEIINIQGQTVLFSTTVNQIDVSKLSSGTYMVKFIDQEQTITIKNIVKQ